MAQLDGTPVHQNVQDIYSLTPLQEGILFHSVNTPESQYYFEQLSCRLTGSLDAEAFRAAWEEVVERQDVFRTLFVWQGLERPLQVVQTSVDLPWKEFDWRHLGSDEQERQWNDLRIQDRAAGFDLSSAPLLRLKLARIGSRQWKFLMSHHHLLLDGWSLPLVLKEVFQFYREFTEGHPASAWPAQPYREYVQWLQQQDMQSAEQFWRDQLAGFEAPTQIGEFRAGEGDGSAHCVVRLPVPASRSLQHWAHEQGLTLNTTVQGAWALLLSRYTNSNDVTFGVTVSGRSNGPVGVENVIGLCINTLPLRVQIDGAMETIEWLRELQQRNLQIRHFEYAPLLDVQGWSCVPRGRALFESLLVFENYPLQQQDLAALDLEVSNIEFRERSNYPLSIEVNPGAKISFNFTYDTARFEASAIEQIGRHLLMLLESLQSGAGRSLGELRMVSPAEAREMLFDWNRTQRERTETTVVRLLEEQARRAPEATAVAFQGRRMSYGELNGRANQLAHYLREMGVGAEQVVGVRIDRSPEMIVSLAGILKAGAAYLPLDPDYPPERLAYMLQDAGVQLVLTTDFDWERIASFSSADLGVVIRPEQLAYVIYTSGSTGRPKGVMLTHSGLANLVAEQAAAFQLGPGVRTLQLASLSFDAAVSEIWTALASGSELHLGSREEILPGQGLANFLAKRAIEVVTMTPTALSVIPSDNQLTQVRTLVVAGEACSAELAERWRVGRRMVNAYGPTETTVCATMGEIRTAGKPDIGGPIGNVRVYVLDAQGQPAPVGVAGELYIGGAGVGRGYLGRPDLTAERFVPDTFSEHAGARLYRSGDQVRWRGDGTLEYLGRLDEQVKVRGMRIELGEIEAVLKRQAGVGDAVVIARDEDGERRLAAYVTAASGGASPNVAELRQHARATLPEHMIPAAWVVLDQLPLTPSGKLDRKALPVPSAAWAEVDAAFAAPRSPVEDEITAIWRELLHVAHAGRNENFFDLGGHSLLAMQVVAHVNEAFQVALPVQSLFDAPKLGDWAACVETARQTNATRTPPPTATPRPERLPLSSAQQRMWVLNRLEPNSPSYHIAGQIRLKGPLDRDALESSLNEMIERHEALRTSIRTMDGQPVQIIAAHLRIAINVHDLRALPGEEAEQEWRRRARMASELTFDLSAGPLLRAHLHVLSTEEHVFQIVLHHSIADGWSLGVWMRELARLYEAHISGKPHSLALLSLQYADYAMWQRKWLQSPERDRSVAYWKGRLADLPALELPTDRPRPAEPSYRGGEARSHVSQSTAKAVRELGRQEGVTLFMVLLAAWQALLSRYSGQRDIAVGTVAANRSHSELEPLIGLFVNTLVLRTDFSDDPLVEDLLARVRQVTLEAYDHQELPFEQVVDELQPARSLSRNPLFQVMFVFQNTPAVKLELGSLRIEPIHLEQGVAKFDLTLEIEERDGYFDLRLEYASDLFDPSTAERMLRHYEVLLEAFAAGAGKRVSELPLLSPADRRQVLDEWNRTETAFDSRQTAVGLFEARVDRKPFSTAVVCGDQELSYLELNAQANQLAHYLRKLGVGPDSLVGLCVERSAAMLVGLLGILKAGGAYVPLDPEYPPERLAYMLSDAGIQVLLTEQKLIGLLPEHGARAVRLDTQWPLIALESSVNPDRMTKPHNAGYVIYTSGSTGRPKGVVVTRAGMLNLARAQQQIFGLKQDDAVLQFASPSFDAAVWEWLMALTAGARLVIGSSSDRLAGRVMEDLIRTRSVTVATLPPSALSTISAQSLSGLKTLVVAGEACPADLVRQWAPGRRMLNAYGPTEAAVCATVSAPLDETGDCPIGRPIANTEMYVLDGQMQPVPIGVAGELYIGGAGLARGYLNRPDLTAERFVPHPHSAIRGARLYRTGDLGRWRADRTLEFLGRADQQVKIRGHRIEPGEVETALREIPEILTAAVIGREDQPGQSRLVAYVVPRNGHVPPVTELRLQLAAILPDYMIPSAFVPLEALPVSPNGKLDRKALPAPDARLVPEAAFVAPRTHTEELLAGIWRDLLRVHRVGVRDNFFELGGDSIMAIQAVSKANQAGLRLTPKQLFQQQSIEKLAAVANTTSKICAEQGVITGEVPLTPIQRWFFEQNFAAPHHWNQSILLEVRTPIAPEVLAPAVQALLRHHDALRARFYSSNGEWHQQIAGIEAAVPFEYIDCRGLKEKEFLATLEHAGARTQSGLDLSRGPLFRVAYFHRGAQCSGRLLLVAHHLIIDGVSWRILVEDLENACRKTEFPAKTTSIRQWSRGVHEFASSWLVRTDADYWLDSARSSVRRLPLDVTEGPNDAGSGECIAIRLASEETHALLHETAKAYHTQTSDLLLTALALAHAKWTGDRSLLVDLEAHGREPLLPDEDLDLSRTVGWFTSLYPMLLSIPHNAGFRQAINSVKEQLRRAPKRGIGYGLLRYLSGDHELMERMRALPSAEISFNYLGQVDAGIAGPSGLFELASENCGAERNDSCHRTHLLDVTAQIAAGVLEVTFHYSRNRHRGHTIEQLAESFMDSLRTLITHCREPESGNYVPTRTLLERQIAAIWEDVLNRGPIGVADHFFFDLGGNSLLALAASARLQEVAGPEISAAIIFQEPTIERMARVIQSNSVPRVRLPLVPIQPKGSKRPFFCVHPAPGSVFCYFDLAQCLGEDQPFYGLQAQGLEAGEAPLDRIEEMAALYIDAIRSIDRDGPYLIGGHSFGALVAYEMAQQLQQSGSSISRLVILDCVPPVISKRLRDKAGPPSHTELLEAAAAMIERFTSSNLSISQESLARLNPEAQITYFLDRLRDIRFISGSGGAAYVQGLLRVLRANGVALSRYAPPPITTAPVTVIRAGNPRPEDYPSEFSEQLCDPAYGWNRIGVTSVDAFTTPGDHITMLTLPNVEFLAQQLRSCFDKATTKVQYAG